jgi:hypothetical protein
MESGIHLCVPYGPMRCIIPEYQVPMELACILRWSSSCDVFAITTHTHHRTPHRTTGAAPRQRPCSEGNQETLIPSHIVVSLPPSNIIMIKTVPAALVACVLLPSACVGFVPPSSRQLREQTQVSTFNRMPRSMLFMSDSDQDVSSHIII